MKLVLTTFVITLLLSCQPTSTPSPGGDLAGYTLESIPGSDFERAYKIEGKRIVEEGQVWNGKKNGTWVTYHNNPRNFPKVVITYVDGKRSGPYMEFNPFGQFLMVAHYQDDQLNGRMAKYDFTRIKEEIHYKDGEMDGLYTLYYDNSDQVQRTAEFKDGKENGWIRYYNEEGKLTMEYEYRNGEKISGGIVD